MQAGFHLGYLTSLFIVGFIADHFGAKRAYIGLASPPASARGPSCCSPTGSGPPSGCMPSPVYARAAPTPALALINDHVERARRGRAMGFLIAGSSAGYAIPLLAAGAARISPAGAAHWPSLPVLPVVSWITAGSVLRGTPNTIHARPAGESLLASMPAVWRNRRGMLSIWGYTFHNWELLGSAAAAFLTGAGAAWS